VEYHHQYNSFKQTLMMISNNISIAWNDLALENKSQQQINQPAAFITQDPELMYIAANSARIPQQFQPLETVRREKQYQSALNKISGQLTPANSTTNATTNATSAQVSKSPTQKIQEPKNTSRTTETKTKAMSAKNK